MMESSPGGVSSSTIRREMRVFPVPQGRMILPRAWPTGSPPLSDCSCSLRMRTLSVTASFCMQVFVCLRSSPSGFGWQCGHSSLVDVVCCWSKSLVMLTCFMGFFLSPGVRGMLGLMGLSPLVTSQRSAQRSSADEAMNLFSSSLLMLPPRPCSSNWRDLHWMAMCSPSLRRTATASMPMSWLVVLGKRASRSGHSVQR